MSEPSALEGACLASGMYHTARALEALEQLKADHHRKLAEDMRVLMSNLHTAALLLWHDAKQAQEN